MAVRAIVTITNAKTVVSSTKIEAQTSHLKAQSIVGFSRLESLAAIDENSKNQWKTDEFLLSEVIVSAYTKPLTETLSISETSLLALDLSKSETLSLTEAFAKAITFNRNFTDAFTLDDAATIDKDYFGVKGNVAFMLEVIGLSLDKIATDSYTVGDIHDIAVNKVVTENLSLIENAAKEVNTIRTDAFSVSESTNVHPNLGKTDSVSFSDLNYATLNKIVTDSITLQENLSNSVGETLDNSFTFSDSIISQINKVITDAFTLDDSALIDKDYFGNKGNICTVSDVIALAVAYARSFSDSVSIGDSTSVSNISGKVLNGGTFNRITLN
tara:strand:+ start:4434 stop:5417 length:984 start_codon:yes stop_codon:yes gene_type:complete